MTKNLEKHPVYKLNTDEVDFSNFKVLLVYANSPMDNLFPVGISSIAGMLRKHKKQTGNTMSRLRVIQSQSS